MNNTLSELAASIRSIPDYPKPGIIFRDITTLLGNPRAFRRAVDELVQPYAGLKVDKIAGMSEEAGYRVMMTAHKLGSCVVVVCTKDIAETKAKEAIDLAKEMGFPLMFTTEPEE